MQQLSPLFSVNFLFWQWKKKKKIIFAFVKAVQLTTNFQQPVSKFISRNRPLLSGQKSEPTIIMDAYIVILFKIQSLTRLPFPLNDQTHHLICMFIHTLCFPVCRQSKKHSYAATAANTYTTLYSEELAQCWMRNCSQSPCCQTGVL